MTDTVGAVPDPQQVVSLVPPAAAASTVAAAPVTAADVQVLPQAQSSQIDNRSALAFVLRRHDLVGSSASVGVSIDYSKFRELYGGNWASRLQVFRYPSCVLTTPSDPVCSQGTKLPAAVNDVVAGRLTVDAPVDPDPAVAAAAAAASPSPAPGVTTAAGSASASVVTDAASPSPTPSSSALDPATAGAPAVGSSGGVLVLAAMASSPNSNYTATLLQASGDWQVGEGSGGFSWSHQIPVAPAPYGVSPGLSLDYSSAQIDGKTIAANSQTSTVGEGWELGAPYIERTFAPCQSYLASRPAWGDLCYPGAEFAHLVNNGSSTPLVYVAAGEWRLQNDDGTRIQRLIGAANGDSEKVYWVVTDAHGTKYWYGLGHQRTSGSPNAATSSTLNVLVNASTSRCNSTSAWCPLAYRWYLDRVVDPTGHQSTYFYAKESNKYNSLATSNTAVSYDRAAILKSIEYGAQASAPEATNTNVLTFDYEIRCRNNADALVTTNWNNCSSQVSTDEPDVPYDQMCSTTCTSSQTAPTFFTRYLLRQVGSFVAHAGTKAQWLERFFYTFPSNGDASSDNLWLYGVQHIGLPSTFAWKSVWAPADYDTTGQTLVPMIQFSFTGQDNTSGLYANRRFPGNGVLPLYHYRLRMIQNELSGRVYVNYSTDSLCADQAGHWDTQTTRCFPSFWSPPGGTPGYGVFLKYTVDSVVQSDRWAPHLQPDVTTAYTYQGALAWHYQDIPSVIAPKDANGNDALTWNDWRGYGSVMVTTGSERTQYTVYRGLQGDRRAATGCTYAAPTVNGGIDWPYNQGKVAVIKYLKSSGVSRQVVEYGYTGASLLGNSTDPNYCTKYDHVAYLMANNVTTTTTSEGVTAISTKTRTYDVDGRPTTERTVTTASGTVTPAYPANNFYGCTTTEYATTAATPPPVIQDAPARVKSFVQTSAQTCAVGATVGTQIDQSDTYYDANTTALIGVTLTRGLPTSTVHYSGATASVTTKLGYDSEGRVASATNGRNITTTTGYTPTTGYPDTITVTSPPPVSGAANLITSTSFDARWNAPATVTDPAGEATTLRYDDLGRLVCVFLPQSPVSPPTGAGVCDTSTTAPANQVFVYRNTGSYYPSVITRTRFDDNPNPTMVSRYDYLTGWGQPLETQTLNPGPSGNTLVTDTFYDSDGNTTAASLPALSATTPGAALIRPAESGLDETRTGYDEFHRPTSTGTYHGATQATGADGFPIGSTTTYTPVGSKTVPSAGGGALTYADAAGRSFRNYALATTTGTLEVDYGYAYDAAGRLTTTRTAPSTGTGAASVATTVTNWLDQATTSDPADAAATQTDYDANGNPSTITGPTSTLRYTYDGLDRPLSVTDLTTSNVLRTWTYDTTPATRGKLTSDTAIDGQGHTWTRAYQYDTAGRANATTITPYAGSGFAASYTTSSDLGEAGQVLRTRYPSATGTTGETIDYGYNTAGLPTTVTGAATYVSASAYNDAGQLATRTYIPNTTAWNRTFTYTPITRNLANAKLANAAGTTTAQDDTFAWSAAGNLMSVSDAATGSGQTGCYGYDTYQRLTRAVTVAGAGTSCTNALAGTLAAGTGPVPWAQGYSYDNAGDLTQLEDKQSAATTTYAYPTQPTSPTPHLPTTITTTGQAAQTVQPDPAGRVTTLGATALTWDQFGKTASIVAYGTTSTNSYAADGTRLARTDTTGPNAATTLFLPEQEITKSPTGVLSYVRYIHQAGATVAIRSSDTNVALAASDIQNTPTITVDAAGTITRRYATPYGATVTGSGTLPGQRGFLGHVLDPSGILDDAARPYSPALGLFLAPDPLAGTAPAAASNPYAYAADSPATLADPTGLEPCSSGSKDCNPSIPGSNSPNNDTHGEYSGGGDNRVPTQVRQTYAQYPDQTAYARASVHQQGLDTLGPTGTYEPGVGKGEQAWAQAVNEYCAVMAARCSAYNAVEDARADRAAKDSALFAASFIPVAGWIGRLAGVAGKLGRAAEGESGLISARSVRFTQDSAGSTFKDGRSVFDLGDEMAATGRAPESMPPIRIFEKGGSIHSLDNRRLFAGQYADVDLPYVWATPAQIAARDQTQILGGTGIFIRMGGGVKGWWEP